MADRCPQCGAALTAPLPDACPACLQAFGNTGITANPAPATTGSFAEGAPPEPRRPRFEEDTPSIAKSGTAFRVLLQAGRSIVAVGFGMCVAFLAVLGVEQAGHKLYPPPFVPADAGPEALQKMMDEMPVEALIAVLLAWQAGAFFGGAAAAFIADRRQLLHAGIIGCFILLGSVASMMMIAHPVWMKIAGLLMPMPMSLIAGKIVSILSPASPTPQPPVARA